MSSWTDDRVERLKTLWLDGHSASAVARQLGGVTRNAVIGKVHRLGLSGRAPPSPPSRLGAARSRPRLKLAKPSLRLVAPAPAAAVPRLSTAAHPATSQPSCDPCESAVPLLQVTSCGCRFGLGDPRSEAFGFCDAPRVRGSYCARHAEIVFQPVTGARAQADRRLIDHLRRTG